MDEVHGSYLDSSAVFNLWVKGRIRRAIAQMAGTEKVFPFVFKNGLPGWDALCSAQTPQLYGNVL